MKKGDDIPGEGQDLRRRAEERLNGGVNATGQPLTLEESQRLLHELQVHQLELEMQNEELHRTRSELETALSRYMDRYDFAPVGYVTLGPDGTIRTANLTGADLLGVERSRLIDRRLGQFISPESRPVFADFLAKVFTSEAKETCEVVLRKKGHHPLIMQIEAVLSESGQECLAAIIDVTEHKELEQRLLQAQKMETIGLFAGGVAHDFNNLLTAISGYGQILQEHVPADNEMLRESVEQVLKAAGRAAELTSSLLAFSRKQAIRLEPVIVDTIIDNAGKLIRRVIGEDIEFSVVFSCKELVVMADAGQIEQVLMNLATNARDAMPEGGRLSISTKDVMVKEGSESLYVLPTPGRYALISVADTGTGIEKESLERIFEPFYTTKEVGKGTGLGLSIAHGVTKQHGGSVQVSSEPGKGTTFNIYLPLIVGNAVRSESKIARPLAGGTETILFAEDEELVRVFTKRILEMAGYQVIVAENGEEAVARFKEHGDISLVLSDVVMPRKTGKAMIGEIKRIKPEIKVIFITGYDPDIMHDKGMHEEGVEFIRKPFRKSDLLRKIREVLDRD